MTLAEPLWTSSELEMILGVKSAGRWFASGIQTDSRLVVPGDLFVALEGQESDGHLYVADAFRRGAVAALVHKMADCIPVTDTRLYFVENSFQALLQIAAASRERVPAKVIAVTGSVGKTSVVQAIRASLSHAFPAHSSIKSFNNHVGVPLSLARMDRNCRQAVFELGMSAQGEIAPLSQHVKPDVAIITTIGAAHRQSFEGLKAIAEEKAAIFDGMQAGGIVIIGMGHAYDGYLVELARKKGLQVRTVGFDKTADYYPTHLNEDHTCSCLSLQVNGQLMTVKINQAGREWVQNAMLVIAAVDAVGGDVAEAGLTLASLRLEKGRGRLYDLPFKAGLMTLQDDSYNANPLSMMAALKRFIMIPPQKGQPCVAILGDMMELGDSAQQDHDQLMPLVRRAGFDLVIAVGPHMYKAAEAEKLPVIGCENLDQVMAAARQHIRGRERIFVKGSNSWGLEKLVNHLIKQSQFEERMMAYESRQLIDSVPA